MIEFRSKIHVVHTYNFPTNLKSMFFQFTKLKKLWLLSLVLKRDCCKLRVRMTCFRYLVLAVQAVIELRLISWESNKEVRNLFIVTMRKRSKNNCG